MLPISKITNYHAYYYERISNSENMAESDKNSDTNVREKITTWRFDEEGNIVYYTIDKKTGKIISITKYKNPIK